jgi:hypothetical protein
MRFGERVSGLAREKVVLWSPEVEHHVFIMKKTSVSFWNKKILFCQETNVLMIEKKRKKIFHCKKKISRLLTW